MSAARPRAAMPAMPWSATSPSRQRRRELRGTWAVGVSVAMGIAGAEAPAPREGGAGAPLQLVQEPILSISCWSLATMEEGSFGYPRSGPKPWPVGPVAYFKNAFSVDAFFESCGTMT